MQRLFRVTIEVPNGSLRIRSEHHMTPEVLDALRKRQVTIGSGMTPTWRPDATQPFTIVHAVEIIAIGLGVLVDSITMDAGPLV